MTADSKDTDEIFATAARREEWYRRPQLTAFDVGGGRFVITKYGRVGVMMNSMILRGNDDPAVKVGFSEGADQVVNLSELRFATKTEVDSEMKDVRLATFDQWSSLHPDHKLKVAVPPMSEERRSMIDDIWARASAESKAEMVKAIADALMTHVIVTEVRGDEREEIETFRMINPTPVGDTLTIARKEELPNGTRQIRCVTYKVIKSHGHMTQGYNGQWQGMTNLEVQSMEGEIDDKSR